MNDRYTNIVETHLVNTPVANTTLISILHHNLATLLTKEFFFGNSGVIVRTGSSVLQPTCTIWPG